jgi:uncharacterized protein (TIGR04222 family)
MNPLDFTGPAFLVFYAAYGAAVCLALYWLNWSREPQLPSGPAPTDPYTIAFLRGGPAEALRVAAVTLLERGALLLAPGDTLHVSRNVSLRSDASPIERAVHQHFAGGEDASSIFRDEALQITSRTHAEPALEAAGLIPDVALKDARQRRFLFALVALAVLAGLKITVALSRGHSNVGLLLVAVLVCASVAYRITRRHRTPAGDRTLDYLMQTFAPTRGRVQRMNHPPPEDMAVVAAVFGFGALEAAAYAQVKALQPTESGGGCGGGGGGCGGCGGCGG